jgi:hypothetical protein
MIKKTTTTVEKYDENENLVERTITVVEHGPQEYAYPTLPYTGPRPWYQWPLITYTSGHSNTSGIHSTTKNNISSDLNGLSND